MKTIFITIFEGVEVKNVLRTPILKNLLADEDVKIVLFTKSKAKVDHYAAEFNHPRIFFEVVEWKSNSRLDTLFSKLKFVLLRTETTNLKRKMVSEYEQRYFGYYVGLIVNFLLARSFVRKIVRYLDFALVKDSTYSAYFDMYSPKLVFLAHLFDEPEISLLREAKKRGIMSVGFVNSWDKVTSRCILRLLPDKAITFNSIVKDELIHFNEMKPENIFVSGLPQYDYFYTRTPILRENFFNKISISPEKNLIVYASMGRAFSTSDWDMIDLLHTLTTSNKIAKSSALLVRFQPNDFIDQEEIKKRPYLKYDQPGIRFGSKRGVDWDMNFADLEHLADTLHHAALVVCYASSISIDAAVFDKPIINIDFEVQHTASLLKSPTQYYKSLHYGKALKTGGINLVKSEPELIDSINKYLLDPRLHSRERARLVFEQTVYTDGNSGKRIAEYLLSLI